MCYNKEVSIVLFLFGISCSIKLFLKGANAAGLYLISLSLIQLVEFFLHVYKNPKSSIHQIATLSIPIVLVLQIIVCIVGVYLKNTNQQIKDTTVILGSFYIIISLFIFFKILIPKFGKFDSTPLCKNGCRLQWDFLKYFNWPILILSSILYVIVTLINSYYVFDMAYMIIVGILLILCILFKHKSFGTLWCFWAIFTIIFAIIFDDNIKPD